MHLLKGCRKLTLHKEKVKGETKNDMDGDDKKCYEIIKTWKEDGGW